MKSLRASLVWFGLIPAVVNAQVELIAGWNFGQFISGGLPSTDGTTGEPVGFIASNFTQSLAPLDTDSGPSHIINGVASVFSAGSGVFHFDGTNGSSAWDIANGTDISVLERGSLVAINHNLVNGGQLFTGDINNANLRFISGANTAAALTVNTTGFSDYDASVTTQPNDFNFTFSAFAASGGSATISWLYEGVIVGTAVTVQAGEFQAFNVDLPSGFFGKTSAALVAQISGDLVLDNLQVNGVRATAPVFDQPPASQSVTAGTDVTFTVVVSGAASPTYQWRKGGVALANGVGIAGATTASLTLAGVTPAQAGSYTVVANNNGASAESLPAILTVNTVPVITGQPASSTANPGGTISFSVEVSGGPAPTLQWRKGDSPLTDGPGVSGANSPTLTLTNLTVASSGFYSLVATNVAGTATSNPATLTVTEAQIAPTIQESPGSATTRIGQEVLFRVAASGAPAPTYQWFFQDQPLADGPGIVGATSANLRVTPSSSAAAGEYFVVVTNSAGEAQSTKVTLTVQVAPTIPAGSAPLSQSANVGGSVTFTVAATGLPTPTYQWRKGGENLPGQTNPSLVLNGISLASAGSYSVVVTNAAGSVESTAAQLTVYQPAEIVTDPVAVTVGTGSPFTLSVVASGSPAPTYQWFKNGESVPDATGATFTITSAKSSDVGNYTVVATNPGGSDTSAAARVDVAVRITRVAGTQVVAPTTQIILDSQFLPDGGYRFQWLRNGKVIRNATGSTYLIPSAAAADSGAYAVKIFAASGRLLKTVSITNLRVTVAGTYDALLRDPVSNEPVGRLQLVVADAGAYTGTLIYEDAKTYALKSLLTFPTTPYQGTATLTVPRTGGAPALRLAFALDARELSLAVTLSTASAPGITLGQGAGSLRAANTVAWRGAYSLALAPQTPVPAGQPTATVTLTGSIDAKGVLALSGRLADGTAIKASIPASAAATYAIFLLPYKSGGGTVAGDLKLVKVGSAFRADLASSGVFFWVRPAVGANAAIDARLVPTLAPR